MLIKILYIIGAVIGLLSTIGFSSIMGWMYPWGACTELPPWLDKFSYEKKPEYRKQAPYSEQKILPSILFSTFHLWRKAKSAAESRRQTRFQIRGWVRSSIHGGYHSCCNPFDHRRVHDALSSGSWRTWNQPNHVLLPGGGPLVFFSQQISADLFWSDVSPCCEQQSSLRWSNSSQGCFSGHALLVSHGDGLEFLPVCHRMKTE